MPYLHHFKTPVPLENGLGPKLILSYIRARILNDNYDEFDLNWSSSFWVIKKQRHTTLCFTLVQVTDSV